MVSPLDPDTMFNQNPLSMWDTLAEQFAEQGIAPPQMMAFGEDKASRPRVVPTPGGPSGGMRGITGAVPSLPSLPPFQDPAWPYSQYGAGKDQARPPAGPPIPINQFVGPLPPNAGSPLDPMPEPSPQPEQPPGAPLDIRSAQQQGGGASAKSVKDSLGLAMQGLKMMEPQQLKAPAAVAPPRADTSGIGRIDPIVLMQNAQRAGVAPLLMLSQLLGRG